MHRIVPAVLSAALVLVAIAWALSVPRSLGMSLYTEQFLCVMLALALPITLLGLNWRGEPRREPIPAYDWIAGALGFGASLYMAVHYEQLMLAVFDIQTDALLVSVIVVLGLLEATRRIAGLVLALLIGFFLLLGAFGHLLAGPLQGREVPPAELFVYLATDANAILGTPLLVSATIVVAFLLVGELLFRSGGAYFFTDIAMALMGRFRGGPAKIAVIASALFGSVSGSAVSNVASTGVITIPMMTRTGYSAKDAGAIEAVASTGGQLMPPIMGAAAFLMAEFLQIPYRDVVVAALVPAILFYVSLFILVDLYAVKHRIAALSQDQVPDKWQVLRRGGAYAIPFVVLIAALFVYSLRAEIAALLAAMTVLVIGAALGYGTDRLTARGCVEALVGTGRTAVTVIVIAAGAGIVIGALNVTGIGFSLTDFLAGLGEGSLAGLLILTAVLAILLGMGMPTVGVYVLLATMLAPSLVAVGVDPIAAHLFILYFGMLCMITPPIALAAFTAASIADTRPMETAVRASVFGWVAYLIPFLFVLSPSLLLKGSALDNLLTPLTAIAGIWLVCSAISGYLMGPLGRILRVWIGFSGLLLMIPLDASALGWVPSGVGGAAAAAAIAWIYLLRQKSGGASAAYETR